MRKGAHEEGCVTRHRDDITPTVFTVLFIGGLIGSAIWTLRPF